MGIEQDWESFTRRTALEQLRPGEAQLVDAIGVEVGTEAGALNAASVDRCQVQEQSRKQVVPFADQPARAGEQLLLHPLAKLRSISREIAC
jgi:hypothetical protein